MTLQEYLETLPARPGDPDSPLLIVARDDLTRAQKDALLTAPYNRAPYLIVEGAERIPNLLHSGRGIWTGTIRVIGMQTMTLQDEYPAPDTLAAVMAGVLGAREVVDELESGIPLVGRLGVTLELEPRKRPQRGGLRANINFLYRIQR